MTTYQRYDRYGCPIPEKAKRPSKKLTIAETEAIRMAVQSLSAYRHWAVDMPIENTDAAVMELVDSTLPADIIFARNAMVNHPYGAQQWMESTYYTCVVIDNIKISVKFDQPKYVSGGGTFSDVSLMRGDPVEATHVIAVDNPYYTTIKAWAEEHSKLRKASHMTSNLINHVLTHCNTSGQIYRAWPALIDFMPEEIAHALSGATRGSRLPNSLNILRVNDERDDATTFLALMSLMKGRGGQTNKMRVV